MIKHSASCSCGAAKVDCTAPPFRVTRCYCLACQRRTGSSSGLAAFFRPEDVEATGKFTSYERIGDSGLPVVFHFCPICGSTVYWEPAKMPDRIAIAVGAFADPSFPGPEADYYYEHRHNWAP